MRGVVDLRHMAIWSLRDALEERHRWNLKALDGLVPGAVEWILKAGRLLRTADQQYGAAARPGPLFKGKEGFSPERWAFWKERFQWVQAQAGLHERTRGAAKQAEELMKRLD